MVSYGMDRIIPHMYSPLLLDPEDQDRLKQKNWYFWWPGTGNRYLIRATRVGGGKRLGERLHREITDAPKGIEVDHVNGDGFDNRRCNLRLATDAENAHNAVTRKDNTSGYKGVSWHRRIGKWQAYVNVGGSRLYLGYYDDPREAYRVRSEKAQELHGKFARLR